MWTRLCASECVWVAAAGPVVAYIGAAKAASTPYAREWEALQQLLPPSQLQLRFAYSREMKAPDGGRLYVQVCTHVRQIVISTGDLSRNGRSILCIYPLDTKMAIEPTA